MLKEALQAYLLQRLAPEPMTLSPAQMLYLATRAGAEALGTGRRDRRFHARESRRFRLPAARRRTARWPAC